MRLHWPLSDSCPCLLRALHITAVLSVPNVQSEVTGQAVRSFHQDSSLNAYSQLFQDLQCHISSLWAKKRSWSAGRWKTHSKTNSTWHVFKKGKNCKKKKYIYINNAQIDCYILSYIFTLFHSSQRFRQLMHTGKNLLHPFQTQMNSSSRSGISVGHVSSFYLLFFPHTQKTDVNSGVHQANENRQT